MRWICLQNQCVLIAYCLLRGVACGGIVLVRMSAPALSSWMLTCILARSFGGSPTADPTCLTKLITGNSLRQHFANETVSDSIVDVSISDIKELFQSTGKLSTLTTKLAWLLTEIGSSQWSQRLETHQYPNYRMDSSLNFCLVLPIGVSLPFSRRFHVNDEEQSRIMRHN